MASLEGNKKVAQNRGEKWKENLIAGRLEAEMHPTQLKIARFRKKLSQLKLAQKLGKSLSTYGAIERGRIGIKEVLVRKLSSLLGRKKDELFRMKNGRYIALK